MGNENVFHNTLERKTPLKTVKTVTGKSRKTGIFFVHCFGQKLAIFHVFILVEIGKKYVFYDILDRKKRLRRQQEEEVKNFKKNCIFAKGLVHGFDQNLTILPSFLF